MDGSLSCATYLRGAPSCGEMWTFVYISQLLALGNPRVSSSGCRSLHRKSTEVEISKNISTPSNLVLGFNLRTLKQIMWFMSYCSLYSWMYAWIWFLGRLHVVVLCFVLLQISLEIDTCLSAGNVIFVVVVVCSRCSTMSANSTKNKQMLDS